MPRNLEARNFLSLLQRSPSPLLPFPLPRSPLPSVQSALCPSSQSPRSHLPSSTLLLHSIFAFFVLRHTPSSPRHPSYTFSSSVSSRPLDLYLSSPFLSLSLSLFAALLPRSIGSLSPSLSKRTHSRINRYGRVTRVYIGGAPRGPSLITYPAVAARVNDGKGCVLHAKDFFSITRGRISIK